MTRSLSASLRGVAVAAGMLALSGVPGLAAEPGYGSGAGGGSVELGSGAARRLDLSIGRSVVVELTRDAKEIFVANPAVANAVVRSTRKLFLLGVANGSTSVFVMDAEGRQIASLEVNVGRDLNVLRQTLRATIPNGRIDVKPAGDSILLTGTVNAAGDAQQAVDIAKAFVGQAGGGQGAAAGFSGSVINALSIVGRDQVMLKVSVVEMARSVAKQLGVNVTGNWNLVSVAAGAAGGFSPAVAAANTLVSGIAGTAGPNGGTLGGTASFGNGNSSVSGTLSALERAGVSRTLAEPTLVAVSGESATFLVGGEIPIPSFCAGGAGCISTAPTFKPFGISLAFTPVVLSEGRISMRISTEVSEIASEISVQGVPGFRTRKTATSIELPSGGTLMSAGLISAQSSQTIQGVPGLINLPILGALFRSRDFQRRETELMIMVTPYIAKPMEAAQAKRPDDGFVDANDPDTVFMGRINKLYGAAGPGPAAGTRSGKFGFITD